jgi:hypothetical protein
MDEKNFLVVVRDGGGTFGLSRRQHGERPFSGEWGLLDEAEAKELADALAADPTGDDDERVEVVEVFRYVNDPAWPEEYA